MTCKHDKSCKHEFEPLRCPKCTSCVYNFEPLEESEFRKAVRAHLTTMRHVRCKPCRYSRYKESWPWDEIVGEYRSTVYGLRTLWNTRGWLDNAGVRPHSVTSNRIAALDEPE